MDGNTMCNKCGCGWSKPVGSSCDDYGWCDGVIVEEQDALPTLLAEAQRWEKLHKWWTPASHLRQIRRHIERLTANAAR